MMLLTFQGPITGDEYQAASTRISCIENSWHALRSFGCSRAQGTCLQGPGPEVSGDAGQLAGEGQQVEVGCQAERQPGIALRVLHQLHQLPRILILACVKDSLWMLGPILLVL